MGKLVKDMSPDELEQKRAAARVSNLTPEQLKKKRENGRVANMKPERLKHERERHRIANMTLDQLEKHRQRQERLLVANLTTEQLEKRREKNRVANITPEQHEQRKEYHRNWQSDYRSTVIGRMSTLRSGAQVRSGGAVNSNVITSDALTYRYDGKDEYTGQPLSLVKGETGERMPNAPSLDQFVPGQGYGEDNVIITSMWLNMAKGKQSWDECRHNLMDAVAHMITRDDGHMREFREIVSKLE